MHTTTNSNTNANKVVLLGENLTFAEIINISCNHYKVDIDERALKKVNVSRQCVENLLKSQGIFYGINTGFGALANVKIPDSQLEELQVNLIRSHACGVGVSLEEPIVRATIALRIQTILRGNSGVRVEVVNLLQEFLNFNIVPYVPSKGSVGASGDLAPLAHIALCLIGEGRVFYKGELSETKYVLELLNIPPLKPQAKEGLSLINGTQVMTATGLLCCHRLLNLLKTADIACSASLDAFKGSLTAFRQEIQDVRPHLGQSVVAQNIRNLLADDGIRLSHAGCDKVQDPYSFRCVPQVHGAARVAFEHVLQNLMIEANSSTDNPLVFPELNEILSGGNFHGQIVALSLDYLAIAVSEIGSISERRIEKLVNNHMSGLPLFLTNHSGLNSGLMIPHVVAAALVNENKIFCTPASVDSIPTSAEKEDHVSMGMTSANKLKTIVSNISHILAIELITAVEGVEFHEPLLPGVGVRGLVKWLRGFVAPIKDCDRSLSESIELIAQKILMGDLVSYIEKDGLGIGSIK